MISIVDYGLGNLKAFANIYKRLNIAAEIVTTVEQLKYSEKIILPGVGAFDHAMDRLNNSGLRDTLEDLVLNKHIPVLGICVGMQILGNSSHEGKLSGLRWIDGEVKKLDVNLIKQTTRLPHMGWNDVEPTKLNPIMNGLEKNSIFYFLHSYYFSCNNPDDSIAESDYGVRFTCAINHNNIFGVQFHPEKSHNYGIQLLKNFANLEQC